MKHAVRVEHSETVLMAGHRLSTEGRNEVKTSGTYYVYKDTIYEVIITVQKVLGEKKTSVYLRGPKGRRIDLKDLPQDVQHAVWKAITHRDFKN